MKTGIKPVLMIDVSDSDDAFEDCDYSLQPDVDSLDCDDSTILLNSENDKIIYLIHNNEIDSDDPNISYFLKFCIKKQLFDNTFYDFNNSYSIMATKLPITFSKIKENGNDDINKKTFIKKFRKDFGFNGDINFIYNCLDANKKGYFTWDDFLDFFLPYIEYVTVR